MFDDSAMYQNKLTETWLEPKATGEKFLRVKVNLEFNRTSIAEDAADSVDNRKTFLFKIKHLFCK